MFATAWAAPAQTTANRGSAHGACGPDHPNIQVAVAVIGDPPPLPQENGAPARLSPEEITRKSDLVFFGRPIRFAAHADGRDQISTTVDFELPQILKSTVGGPPRGAVTVAVDFPGGTAMLNGKCTSLSEPGAAELSAGRLYLITASMRASGRFWRGEAFPIDETDASVAIVRADGWRPGWTGSVATAAKRIRAEVAREKATAKAKDGAK